MGEKTDPRRSRPFALTDVRKGYYVRIAAALVAGSLLVVAAVAIAVEAPNDSKWVEFAAGVTTGIVVALMIFLLESWRELSTRKLEIAAIVHQTRSLRGLDLEGEDLRDYFLGDKDLRDAKLAKADCREVVFCNGDLRGIVLREAWLSGADLSDTELGDADLRDADLSEANLAGSDLTGADLRRADLRNADLRGARLLGAKLQGAKLAKADLARATLDVADLRDADCAGTNFKHASLAGAFLTETRLTGADLSHADFEGAIIYGVDLSGARLDYADFTPETFRNTSLRSLAGFTGTRFGADLRDAGVTPSDLPGASFAGSTVPVDEVGDEEHVPAAKTRPTTRFHPVEELESLP